MTNPPMPTTNNGRTTLGSSNDGNINNALLGHGNGKGDTVMAGNNMSTISNGGINSNDVRQIGSGNDVHQISSGSNGITGGNGSNLVGHMISDTSASIINNMAASTDLSANPKIMMMN